mgnify:CR=1 FL=1
MALRVDEHELGQLKPLAKGGMAEVFRATLAGFGGFERPVAIKRMFRDYGSDPAFVEMLTDEAKIVSQLAHPNIVPVLDAGVQDGCYFLAFEYVDGVDLFRLLQRHHESGRDLPMSSFHVASPDQPARVLAAALARGQNLLLTPGVYDVDRSLVVRRSGTVVLGLGQATLTSVRGATPVVVDGHASDVVVAGVTVDAGVQESRALMQIGRAHV